jgi:hypothetical protein
MSDQLPEKGEAPRRTKIFRKFKGVVNNSARNALPDDAWWYLENMQPIGDANVQTVPALSSALYNYTTHTIYWAGYANVGGVDYIISFSSDGYVYAWNIVAQTNTQIGSGFSGAGSRLSQWKNTDLLVVDTTGYYYWAGTGTLTKLTGTGVPTLSSGTIDIAVAFGRVWILAGRLLTFTGANGFDDGTVSGTNYFLPANGAGTVNLTDPTIRSTLTRLQAQNGYLYIIGPTGINCISDVYVPSGASPPTPLFTNLNIQAIIGSDQPGSIFAMNQALNFTNRFGAWSLYGTNANKISSDIDGTWKYINFSQAISGGQCVVNNILCSAFLIQRLNDPEWGSNTVLAMNHDNKWWFANFGALTFVCSGIVSNEPTLFGFLGNQLYQLFANTSVGPETILQTPLWPMEDELADKQVIRAGFEVTISTFSGSFGMTIDTVSGSSQAVTLATSGNVGWQNNAGNIVAWENNALNPVAWFTGEYLLYNSTSPGVYGKYVGATISASASIYQFSAANMDYKLRARWN